MATREGGRGTGDSGPPRALALGDVAGGARGAAAARAAGRRVLGCYAGPQRPLRRWRRRATVPADDRRREPVGRGHGQDATRRLDRCLLRAPGMEAGDSAPRVRRRRAAGAPPARAGGGRGGEPGSRRGRGGGAGGRSPRARAGRRVPAAGGRARRERRRRQRRELGGIALAVAGWSVARAVGGVAPRRPDRRDPETRAGARRGGGRRVARPPSARDADRDRLAHARAPRGDTTWNALGA